MAFGLVLAVAYGLMKVSTSRLSSLLGLQGRAVIGLTIWCLACALGFGCGGGSTTTRARSPVTLAQPLVFAFVDPQGEPVSSETTRGRPTIAALVVTYDWASQLMLRRVNQALGSYVPRINAFAVILEAPTYAVLAPAFASSLELHFPVVMADQASLDGAGPLGPIEYVPTLVVLDAGGRVVERLKGVVSPEQIKAALDRASETSSGL